MQGRLPSMVRARRAARAAGADEAVATNSGPSSWFVLNDFWLVVFGKLTFDGRGYRYFPRNTAAAVEYLGMYGCCPDYCNDTWPKRHGQVDR
jgi:hypothetical protein